MIWLPVNNYYRVHATVLDRAGQYGLYIAKNGLEDPSVDLIVPDILVRTYLAGEQYKFAYWNTNYWALVEKLATETSGLNRPSKDYIWSRFIIACAREYLDNMNKNQLDAYDELINANPLG